MMIFLFYQEKKSTVPSQEKESAIHPWYPQILADQLTLFQPGGEGDRYHAHHITTSPQIFKPSYGPVQEKGLKRKTWLGCLFLWLCILA